MEIHTLVLVGLDEDNIRRAQLALCDGDLVVLLPGAEPSSWTLNVGETSDQRTENVSVSRLTLNPVSHDVTWDDGPLRLSPREFILLEALARRPRRAWTFAELRRIGWGEPDMGDTSIVRSTVKRLRKKLSHTTLRIQSVPGIGFRLDPGTVQALAG